MEITVTYSSIDGCRMKRKFKTISGAQAFAHKYVGRYPEQGSTYAVSGDGVGKVTWTGCTSAELFPAEPEASSPPPEEPEWCGDPGDAPLSYHTYGGARVEGPHCMLAFPDDEIPF